MMFAVPDTQAFRGQLTLRQQKITRFVAQGLKNDEIAERMGTSELTIKNRLRDVFDETGMSNRTELVIWFVSHGGSLREVTEMSPCFSPAEGNPPAQQMRVNAIASLRRFIVTVRRYRLSNSTDHSDL